MQKFTLRIGFALALGASVTGCAVGPNYQRPSVKLQPFHNAPSIEARTASLPAAPLDQWWTGFHDPELARIVKRALDVIPLTDVLDADRQLLVAKDDLAVAREGTARAAVGSYRALGGGWRP